jgi:hypothetical protein
MAVCLLLAGCGGAGLHKVEGVVLLDGQPLPNASLQFVPQGSGQDATGATDAQGNFVMSTINPRDGVKAGKYKVVVTPRSTAPAQQFASADEAMKATAPQPALASNFPQKYTRVDQTTAEVEVPVKEKKVTINLTSN